MRINNLQAEGLLILMKSKRIGLQRYLLIACLDYCGMMGDK